MSLLKIPKVSFETLKMVIRAYNMSLSKEATSLDEISINTGFSKSQIKRSNPFLIEIGLLIKSKNLFLLSEQGTKYANFLEENDIHEANILLREMILSYEPISLVLNSVKLYRNVSTNKLKERIFELSNSNPDSKDHRTGVNCLIEILQETSILSEKDATYTLGNVK